MALVDGILDLLYPDRCGACDRLIDAPGLCARCAGSLYPLGPACPRCGEPEGAPVAVPCFRCLRAPPPFVRTWAGWRYGGELAVLVRRWKYGGARRRGRIELTSALVPLVAPILAEAAVALDVIVPVPLHARRLRQRGFSQTHLLVDETARRHPTLAARIERRALARTRATADQAGLTRAERARNVAGAFAADRTRVDGRSVLLVDDVMTTGATAAAATRALVAAGATRVEVLALARAEASSV